MIILEWYELLIIGIVLFTLFLILYAGYRIALSIYNPVRHSLLETRIRETEKTPDLMKAYDEWEKIPYQIETTNGYELKAYYLPVEKHIEACKECFVIIAHGYTYTHHGGIKYASIFKELGFNVILYDERYHGESGGKNCSLGYYEEQDLQDIITDTYTRFGPDIYLGTYGESMGGATVILEQAHDTRLQFVIADCSFSDLTDLVTYLVKRKAHLPKWPFVGLANFFFKLATKTDFKSISPVKAIAHAKVPMLLLHGSIDEFIPPIHSQKLFDACSSEKQLYISTVPAKHAESYLMNRIEYTEIVKNFVLKTMLDSKK